ncbi:hypothetical protein WQ57_00655 [Mesobacillus campisalis]|uniref:Amidohydrolase 3 domain-containing protein n=2 Tax=Mesobacillus campisalis TaxID=1408103 RepID=A0A0M2T5H3_9BACI|nr:amidohydrolase [Mesobacillus campisalis]KKK40070.1 hypothetical protein WQ57_00655 [Mesobacillus campisalis]
MGRRAGSVAVKNGRIFGIWQEKEPPKSEVTLSAKTQVINLKGAALLPGFIDTHNHLPMVSMLQEQVNCSSPLNQSISDIQEKLRKKANEIPPGQWILGYGYDDTSLIDGRHPFRADLDVAAPNNPVFIHHISGHLAVVNSYALRVASISDKQPDPGIGHFGRDHEGNVNGVLYEFGPMEAVHSHTPTYTIEQKVSLLKKTVNHYISHGITTNTDAGVGLLKGEEDIEVHLKAAEQKINPMRMQLMIMHDLLKPGSRFGNYSSEQLNDELQSRGNGLIALDSAKMFQDGSIQGLTGALREPYHCNPNLYGDLNFEQSVINEEILDLHNRGYRIAIHGNGDKAIGSILDGFEFAIQKYPRQNHRHRIEHVQTATIQDLDRMQKLGIAGSFFINHVYYWGDRHEKIFLGPNRARRISPLADAVEREILFTLHSDAPITPISPLFSIWAAVNRVTREGGILGPEQRIDVETALKSMTNYGAKLNFDEDHSGSIELGKRADFAILAADPTSINPIDIKDIPILGTIIGGEVVYWKA